jgi:glycosyltransferase involved in cell wall biosynthesis
MKVTVITATTGNPLLAGCLRSVAQQTYKNVTHLVVGDGPEHWEKIDSIFTNAAFPNGTNQFYVEMPYPIGKDRWNAHRIYPAATYMVEGDYVMYLDEDNVLEPNHIESLVKLVQEKKLDWAYSFRKIIDKEGNYLCHDDCESLGKWASVLSPQDFFIDVNCYFVRREVAVAITPAWYRKFREPGQPEVDRVLAHVLMNNFKNFDTTHEYSLLYRVGNTQYSVQKEFFDRGNAEMMRRYNGNLPWKSA